MNTILWLTMLSLVAMSYDQPAVEASPSPGHHEDHHEDTDEDEDEEEVEQCKKVEKATGSGGCLGPKFHELFIKWHKQFVSKYQEVKTTVKTTNFANKMCLDDVAFAKLLTKGQQIYKDMKLCP